MTTEEEMRGWNKSAAMAKVARLHGALAELLDRHSKERGELDNLIYKANAELERCQ